MKWYEWRTHSNRLKAWSRAMQGANPYTVEFEPNPAKCPTAYTDFSKRLMRVNPEFAGTKPRDQYDFTKAMLSHEAGHKRFTTPNKALRPVVAQISNILEDERIERLMESEFAGCRPLLKRLNKAMQEKAPAIKPDSESTADVLNWMLQARWTERSGLPFNGELSPKNQELWEQCQPLQAECFYAETSETCDVNAARIAEILGMSEPDDGIAGMLSFESMEGERASFDKAEEGTGEPEESDSDSEGKSEKPDKGEKGDKSEAESSEQGEAMDGDPTPYEHSAGPPYHSFEPKPYQELVNEAQPLADSLVDVLRFDAKDSRPEAIERGGKFSMREYLHDHSTPFLYHEDRPDPPTMAVRVIIDHSTSMNGHRKAGSPIYQSCLAAMAVHLACTELEIPHVVSITPDDIRVADNQSGELGLALIAGANPALCGYEDMGKTVEKHCEELMTVNADWRVILAIHDGATNDDDLLTEVCKQYRDNIVIIGVGIGPYADSIKDQLLEEFGVDRLIIEKDCSQIGQRLTNIISNIRG